MVVPPWPKRSRSKAKHQQYHANRDSRTPLMRWLDRVFTVVSLLSLMMASATLGLGIHMYLNLHDTSKPITIVVASVVGVLVEISPYVMPHILTWLCALRRGTEYSQGKVTSYDRARIAGYVFFLNMLGYLIGIAASMTAIILCSKLGPAKLPNGKVLELGGACATTSANSQLCEEASSAFLLLCVLIIFQGLELFEEMLVFSLPADMAFQTV